MKLKIAKGSRIVIRHSLIAWGLAISAIPLLDVIFYAANQLFMYGCLNRERGVSIRKNPAGVIGSFLVSQIMGAVAILPIVIICQLGHWHSVRPPVMIETSLGWFLIHGLVNACVTYVVGCAYMKAIGFFSRTNVARSRVMNFLFVSVVALAAWGAVHCFERGSILKAANVIDFASLPQTETFNLPQGVAMSLVKLPAGRFTMRGCSDERSELKFPSHDVTLTKPFYIGTHEVTQKQWASVMGDNPSKIKGDEKPVENVSWDDAQGFISKLNKMKLAPKGMRFRLPTAAEWAYAFNCEKAFALHGMQGGVSEWCQDWLSLNFLDGSPKVDPTGARVGFCRVYCGEREKSRSTDAHESFLSGSSPSGIDPNIGFRIVCAIERDLFPVLDMKYCVWNFVVHSQDKYKVAILPALLSLPDLIRSVRQHFSE